MTSYFPMQKGSLASKWLTHMLFFGSSFIAWTQTWTHVPWVIGVAASLRRTIDGRAHQPGVSISSQVLPASTAARLKRAPWLSLGFSHSSLWKTAAASCIFPSRHRFEARARAVRNDCFGPFVERLVRLAPVLLRGIPFARFAKRERSQAESLDVVADRARGSCRARGNAGRSSCMRAR